MSLHSKTFQNLISFIERSICSALVWYTLSWTSWWLILSAYHLARTHSCVSPCMCLFVQVCVSLWRCLSLKVLRGNLIFVVATLCAAGPPSSENTLASKCTTPAGGVHPLYGLRRDTTTITAHTPFSRMEQSWRLSSRTGVSVLSDSTLQRWPLWPQRLTAALCSFPRSSTTRQQCRLKKTWRIWSIYPYWDRGRSSTPSCSERPCLSCSRRAWWRTACLWWCGGWWSISASMVREKNKNSMTGYVKCHCFWPLYGFIGQNSLRDDRKYDGGGVARSKGPQAGAPTQGCCSEDQACKPLLNLLNYPDMNSTDIL